MKNPARTKKWKTLGLAFVFWTMLALSFAVSNVWQSVSEGQAAPWQRALWWSFADFYLWMALTPWVAWLGRLGASSWRRFWALHLPCSLLTAGGQSAVMLAIFWLAAGPNPQAHIHGFADLLRNESIYKCYMALLT